MSAVAMISIASLISCSDDDDDAGVKIPDSFTVETSSTVNVLWNDTEAVIDFGANESWSATCSESWAQIDPTKGDAGDHRLFLVLNRNYNLLPRTAVVKIQCGETSSQVTITQSGCDDPASATKIDLALETGTVPYSTAEISLSGYSYELENNLGLTVEQFKQAVEEKTVELCIVNKTTDTWQSADYTANGLGYWLDSDMEVTTWDAAGYPANALFIETGEDAISIGRADGIMSEAIFELSFVYRLVNDHSKYLRFNVEITCPVYTPELTIESDETAENVLNVNLEIVGEYNPTTIPYESLLSILTDNLSVETAEDFVSGIENGDISMYMIDPTTGEWLTDADPTAGGYVGYWLGENLMPTGWSGDGYPAITVYIETQDEGIDVGAAPGVTSGMSFDISFVYAKSTKKYVQINLHAYEH